MPAPFDITATDVDLLFFLFFLIQLMFSKIKVLFAIHLQFGVMPSSAASSGLL